MKRHPALRELSSDHHQGLVQARRLVKAAESGQGVEQTARDFLAFWREHTTRHFREEEEVLLPAYARYADPSDAAAVRVLVDHVHIRRHTADLDRQLAQGEPSAGTMRRIGEMLRAHIRHEEDVLFPMIEQALPESELAALPGLMGHIPSGSAAGDAVTTAEELT
jgi:hemerythrin-like domain-containing protein